MVVGPVGSISLPPNVGVGILLGLVAVFLAVLGAAVLKHWFLFLISAVAAIGSLIAFSGMITTV